MSIRGQALLLACAVEGGLLLIALPLGHVFDVQPLVVRLSASQQAIYGIAAALPPLGFFFVAQRSASRALARIRRLIDESLMPLFERSSALELLLVSALAGVGEEALFRGLLQQAATPLLGELPALLLASLAFGLAHAVTLAYIGIATGIGFYFGLLLLGTGDIVVPIIAHAGYDFVALLYLKRRRRVA